MAPLRQRYGTTELKNTNENFNTRDNEDLKENITLSELPKGHDINMKRRKLRLLSKMIQYLILGVLAVYVLIPIILHFSSTAQTNLVFLSMVRWPLFIDLTNPASHGLPATRNFYLHSTPDVRLGVWHILPGNSQDIANDADAEVFETALMSGQPVLLYVHGNSGTRGGSHRVELYQVLRKLGYHVITFDYRGYADSSNVSPTEDGVVHDATFIYKWLRKRVASSPLIVWGHSLGTGVTTKMVNRLCSEGDPPAGVILESPFNNLRDEILHHPFASLYRSLPFFEAVVLDAVEKNIVFASDKSIAGITVPIIILHAEDDKVIPLSLGMKLYQAALLARPRDTVPVHFHQFSAIHQYGHRYICRAPELPKLISDFVQSCIDRIT